MSSATEGNSATGVQKAPPTDADSGPTVDESDTSANKPALDLRSALALESGRLQRRPTLELRVPASAAVPPITRTDPNQGQIGLALSGGGIRSATFCLGVLQELARRGRIASFDYLSTVSGGGYIGSWLSAWIHRAGQKEVQKQLGQFGNTGGSFVPAASEPAEVTWLRRYSNYLAPRIGLLSLDSLTLMATWLRNFILNAVVLIGFIVLLFAAPLELMRLFSWALPKSGTFGFAAAWTAFVLVSAIGYNLWHQAQPLRRQRNWFISSQGVVATVVLPALLAANFTAIWLTHGRKSATDFFDAAVFIAVLMTALLIIWVVAVVLTEGRKKIWDKHFWYDFVIYVLAGAAACAIGALLLAFMHWIWHEFIAVHADAREAVLLVCIAPSAVIFTFGVATTVFTGIVGRVFFERSREWWSRLNAWLISLGLGWSVWASLSFFALPLAEWVGLQLGGWISLLGTGWIASLFTAIFFRKPEAASEKAQNRIETVLNIAAAVFVAGLLFSVASLTGWASLTLSGISITAPVPESAVPEPAYSVTDGESRSLYTVATLVDPPVKMNQVLNAHFAALDEQTRVSSKLGVVGEQEAALLGLLLIVLLFGWRVDINKFSLHNMYKNRLIRCYLGASNSRSRNEQPFTGLDDDDDIPLRNLVDDPKAAEPIPQRPVHVINATLNITQGSNLAWQERKAASFVFTPVICGFSLARSQGDSTPIESSQCWQGLGWRKTSEYAARDPEEEGFTLGMAMATSGAALSPNMGHATSAARAFVLTMFNVRLGRWSANPAGRAWRIPSPRFGLIALLQELFGRSNETSDFVYLSDGGHFDNLGVYELVRRRCKVIFAVDAGADPKRAFGDLGETILKCRVDLGVEITFPQMNLLQGDAQGCAVQGFLKGVIRYDSGDIRQDGTIILIKPTMCTRKTEPADLLNYASQNPPFPQQGTADQFFGESQFESYRRLGVFVADACLDAHGGLLPILAPTDEPLPAQPLVERPSGLTKWIARLFRPSRPVEKLPTRDGLLVDMFFVFLFLTLLTPILFCVFAYFLQQGADRFCCSLEDCRNSLGVLLSQHLDGQLLRNWLTWRIMLDNVFVLIYSATFVFGFSVASDRDAATGKRKHYLYFLFVMVVLGACADYAENFSILDAILSKADPKSVAAEIAPLTLAKFVLFSVNACVLIAMLPKISRVFSLRWRETKGK
jgi:Patatin-like phospholipase